MKIIKAYTVVVCILLLNSIVFSQDVGVTMYFNRKEKKNILIPFKLINNLIVVPFRINNSGILYFILDSGVKTPIITELTASDSIQMDIIRKQKIQGLGEGDPLEVYYSINNNFSIMGIVNSNLDAYILEENIFHLSSKMGTKINGIIGYDVFNSFIVEIDYGRQKLILHNPDYYKPRKSKRFVQKPIIIQNKKAYLNTNIIQEDETKIPVKLLIDTGSSLAIWLSLDSNDKLKLPKKHKDAFLGKGLNGDIYGKQGRIKTLYIGKYKLENPTTSYPESNSVLKTIKRDGRNGSLGAEVLRRFRVIIDYKNKMITFIPNHNFRDKFYYNMSGIEISTPIPDVPMFLITRIEKNSPADLAGLELNDQILSINSKHKSELSLNDINLFFQAHPGRKIRLKVLRNNEIIKVDFILQQNL